MSRTTLTRLARLDLTDLLLRDGAPHLAAHLDTFLWALHHARAEHAPEHTAEISEDQLQRTWLTFVGGGLHPALASREAETEHLETVASRLVPLALASHHCQSPVSSSVATALLANVVLQPLLGQLSVPSSQNNYIFFSENILYLPLPRSDQRAPHHQQAPPPLVLARACQNIQLVSRTSGPLVSQVKWKVGWMFYISNNFHKCFQ